MMDGLVTARTRVIFMIGSPVAQTRSPDLFNRRFRAAGVDRIVVPLLLPPGLTASFCEILRTATNCDGAIATTPLKPAVFGAVDRPTDRALKLGLVNVVRREPDGSLAGDMTDGAGFWNAAALHGFNPAGRRVAIAGAGAAATAIADEFLRRGGEFVLAVTEEMGEFNRLAGILGQRRCGRQAAAGDLSGYGMAINATPLGMAHAPGAAFSRAALATLPSEAIVADAITDPAETELLASARALGLRVMPGEDMTLGAFDLMGGFLGAV